MAGAFRRYLGTRIRAARKGRTQLSLEAFGRELARLSGRRRPYSSVTASNWETGRQEPNWQTLVAIARLTGLPLEYFAGVGALEDYAAKQGADGGAERLALELRILLAASERLDAGPGSSVLGIPRAAFVFGWTLLGGAIGAFVASFAALSPPR